MAKLMVVQQSEVCPHSWKGATDDISRLLVQEHSTSSVAHMCPDVGLATSCRRAVISYTKTVPRLGRVWHPKYLQVFQGQWITEGVVGLGFWLFLF